MSVAAPRMWRIARTVGGAAASQTVLQVVGVVTGLLAIRWMSVEHYAQYTLAFAISTTFMLVLEAGLNGAIIALVGERANDPDVVDEYAAAARQLRTRLYLLLGLPALVVVWILLERRDWSFAETVGLTAAIFVGVWFQGLFTIGAAVLRARGELRRFYRPQIVLSAARLVAFAGLWLASTLTGVVGTGVNALYQALSAWRMRRGSEESLKRRLRRRASARTRAEMRHYIAPVWPGVVFFAFQGQLGLLIVGALGNDRTVAEVGAMTRLGQLFSVLGALNGVLVEPFLARSPLPDVPRRYLGVLALALAVSLPLTAVAFAWPDPLLFLLGDNYEELGVEAGIVVANGSLAYVGSVLLTMNMARRWVFGWATALNIVAIVLAQLVGALSFDLSTTRGALLFGLVTAAATPIAWIVSGLYAWRRMPRGRQLED